MTKLHYLMPIAVIAAIPAWACTDLCTPIPVGNTWTVEILFEGKPLPGATVEIGGALNKSFTTDSDGKVTIGPLPDGDYSMGASKVGIGIDGECILRVSKDGKRRDFKYTWSEKAAPIARMSGRLTEWQWGSMFSYARREGGREVVSAGRELALSGFDGSIRRAMTSTDGAFDFGPMQPGFYVLKVEGPPYVPRLLRLEAGAKYPILDLKIDDVSCGGKALFFRDEVKE